jgi:antitoxin (DNA-binding transcriptional repressor) of toxin-antitoxin stability system
LRDRIICERKQFNAALNLDLNCNLARVDQTLHVNQMKTATVQQAPQKWAQILEWVAAGEEVELTEQEKVIAKVVPANQPDFLARAKKVWGEQPAGKPLSELVVEGRGGES